MASAISEAQPVIPPYAVKDLPMTVQGYEIYRLLGWGGFGFAYKAYQHQKKYIIKLARSGREYSLQREIKYLQRIQMFPHPNVVKLHDVLEVPEGLVLEFAGEEMRNEYLKKGQALSLSDIKLIICQIQSALFHLADRHDVIHRDVKPENIAVSRVHHKISAVLIDFGNAVVSSKKKAEKTYRYPNAVYKAPEYDIERHSEDVMSDVYSLACIAGELLINTNNPLFGCRQCKARDLKIRLFREKIFNFGKLTLEEARKASLMDHGFVHVNGDVIEYAGDEDPFTPWKSKITIARVHDKETLLELEPVLRWMEPIMTHQRNRCSKEEAKRNAEKYLK